MKTGLLFLLQTINYLASCVRIPRVRGAFYHVWKWHNVQCARSEMRHCTTHALYWSNLWQQDHCQHPQNANPDGSTLEGTVQCIRWSFGGGGVEDHIMPHHIFEVGLKVNTKVYLDVLKRVWWSPGAIRWPVSDPGCGSRTRHQPTSPKRPRLGFRKSATTLYPSLTGLSPSPTWTHWTTSFGHTSRTSPTWPPTTPMPAWSPPSTEYSPSSCRRLWKKQAPSSGSVSRL